MTLRNEIAPWRDIYGLVTPQRYDRKESPTYGSGNGLLYSALYYITLYKTGEWIPSDYDEMVAVIRQCEVQRGLFKRAPDCEDHEAYDDYAGLVALGCWCYPQLLVDINAWGERNLWCFNNVNPGKFRFASYLGRYQHLMKAIRMGLGQRMSWYDSYLYSAAIRLGITDDTASDGDTWMMTWLLSHIPQIENYEICRAARNKWDKNAEKVFGNKDLVCANILCDKNNPLGKYFKA